VKNYVAVIEEMLARIFGSDIGAQYWFRSADGESAIACVGLAQRQPARRVERATTFHCFSTTKPVTALAVLQLAAQGRIDLEAPIAEYLKEIPYRNGGTVRQLLSHQAGLPNPLPLSWVHRAEEHARFDRDAFVARLLQEHPQHREPGQRARYSNIGFLLLGRLIETIAGRRYEEHVEREILDVVRDAADDEAWLAFTIPPDRHATGYTRRLSVIGAMLELMRDAQRVRVREGGWIRYEPFYLDGAPYGALVGNVAGWAPLLTAIVRRAESLLPFEWYERFFAPQPLASGRPSGHALAWFTGRIRNHDYLCHAGGGPGYGSEVRIYPALGAASAVVSNTTIVTDTRKLDLLDTRWLP
jgi:CubicO group peptidase (beta-lactamase class C family)